MLAAGAILVHGYHPYVEDAEIYVPGIKKALDPALYPQNDGFFASHAHLTLFPNLIAASVRITHLPLDWALLTWDFLAVFLLLLGCWKLGRLVFADPRAAWGGVALVGSLLTIPIAGTALFLMDQYLNTRSLSTPAVLFIVLNVMEKKFVRAAAWTVATAAIHPLMVVFGAAYAGLYLWMERRAGRTEPRVAALAALLPLALFPPVTEAYREVLNSHSYFLLLRWEWYEWLGIFAPLALLWWFHQLGRRLKLPRLGQVSRALVAFGAIFFVGALVTTVPPQLAAWAKLQPMRSLHLLYVMLFVLGGGLLAQYVLQSKIWRWMVLFVPLCAGMFVAQRLEFPSTPHLELPGAEPANEWVKAFVWIRGNTPQDAYFALDPGYMEAVGEDQHGFRAIAERSRLADRVKDSGAVTMFPALADTWKAQVVSLEGWKGFEASDWQRLHERYGVNWVVLERSGAQQKPEGACPYENAAVEVCKIRE